MIQVTMWEFLPLHTIKLRYKSLCCSIRQLIITATIVNISTCLTYHDHAGHDPKKNSSDIQISNNTKTLDLRSKYLNKSRKWHACKKWLNSIQTIHKWPYIIRWRSQSPRSYTSKLHTVETSYDLIKVVWSHCLLPSTSTANRKKW